MKQKWQSRLQQAGWDELRQGYTREGACLFCDTESTGEQEARQHLRQCHEDPLTAYLALPKPFTGLTDRQKELLLAWRTGTRDAELAERTGHSPSTLRNQRFALREHARQARLFLTALSLSGIEEEAPTPKVRDGIDQYFQDGKLIQMPGRAKKRHQVMLRLLEEFAPGQQYSDQQVRELLKPIHEDYAYIRRYLVSGGFLQRTRDGRAYWRVDSPQEAEEVETMPMDKKAAKLAYKNTVTPMGVYQIADRQTGRFLLARDRNLDSAPNRFQFFMNTGSVQPAGPFSDPQIFADYTDHPDAFHYEIIVRVDTEKFPTYEEAADELERLFAREDAKMPRENRYQIKGK